MSEGLTVNREHLAVMACIYLLADQGCPEISEVAALMVEKYNFSLDDAKRAIGSAIMDGWADFKSEPLQ